MATELVRGGWADIESVRERVPPPFADTKKPTMPVHARSAAERRGNQMGASLHGRTRAETRQRSKEPALTSRPKRRRNKRERSGATRLWAPAEGAGWRMGGCHQKAGLDR